MSNRGSYSNLSRLCCLVLLAACNPSLPSPGGGDGGIVDAPTDGGGEPLDAPDAAPPPPPGTAMETAVGAGRITSTSMVIDVQIGGGLPGAAAGTSITVRPAPALP